MSKEEAEIVAPQGTDPAPQQPAPFHIFIVYTVSGKFHSQVLNLPFEDIDSVEVFNAVLMVLSNAHRGKRVCIINWRSL